MDCGLKEIKMKHDQWSVDLRKWDETWTMKCGLRDMIWNINNDVNNVTDGYWEESFLVKNCKNTEKYSNSNVVGS